MGTREKEYEGTFNLIFVTKAPASRPGALEKRLTEISSFSKRLASRFHAEYDGWGIDHNHGTIEVFIYEIPTFADAERMKSCVKKRYPRAVVRSQYQPSYGEMVRAMPKKRRG